MPEVLETFPDKGAKLLKKGSVSNIMVNTFKSMGCLLCGRKEKEHFKLVQFRLSE